jgi:hypothetical protein
MAGIVLFLFFWKAMLVLQFSQHDFSFIFPCTCFPFFFFCCCDWLARSRTEGMLPKRKTWCLSWAVMSVLFRYGTKQTTTMIGPEFSITFCLSGLLWRCRLYSGEAKKNIYYPLSSSVITIKILIVWTNTTHDFHLLGWTHGQTLHTSFFFWHFCAGWKRKQSAVSSHPSNCLKW